MILLGRLGEVSPPRVINALSVEPTKPRLINSMRAVNLFCRDTPFTLAPLSEIVRTVEQSSFLAELMMFRGTSRFRLPQVLTSMQGLSGRAGSFRIPPCLLAGRTVPMSILRLVTF